MHYRLLLTCAQLLKGYLDLLMTGCLGLQVHYNSVYPLGEAPVRQSKSKVLGSKKLGRFMHAFAV